MYFGKIPHTRAKALHIATSRQARSTFVPIAKEILVCWLDLSACQIVNLRIIMFSIKLSKLAIEALGRTMLACRVAE